MIVSPGRPPALLRLTNAPVSLEHDGGCCVGGVSVCMLSECVSVQGGKKEDKLLSLLVGVSVCSVSRVETFMEAEVQPARGAAGDRPRQLQAR